MSNENEPQPKESEAQAPSSPHVAVAQEGTTASSEHDVSSSSKFDKQRSAKSSRATSCKTTKTEHMKLSARNRRVFQRDREYRRIQYENQLLEDRVRRIQAVPGEYNPDRSRPPIMHLDPSNEKKTRELSRIKKENSIMEERVNKTRAIPGPYNDAQLRSNWETARQRHGDPQGFQRELEQKRISRENNLLRTRLTSITDHHGPYNREELIEKYKYMIEL